MATIAVLATAACSHPEPVTRLADLTYQNLATAKLSSNAQVRQLREQRQSFAESISIQRQEAEYLGELTAAATQDWEDASQKDRLALLERFRKGDAALLEDPYAPFRKIEPPKATSLEIDLAGFDKAIEGVERIRKPDQEWTPEDAFIFAKELLEEAAKNIPKNNSK